MCNLCKRPDLPLHPCLCCSPAVLVSVQPVSYDSALACVKAPSLGGPWDAFQCQSCYKGSCINAPKCSLNPGRRLLAPACQGSIPCELGTLESSTGYR